ncbi:MAG: right-handed parallel beta-helix repeat-containing protein [Limnothrix sp. RL_2_0]|nr:right-handed parallel beta-helix repeat-containing protein [Limnothrix sp. RL_2_0]
MKSFNLLTFRANSLGVKLLAVTPLIATAIVSADIQSAQAEVPIRPASDQMFSLTVNSELDGPITPDALLTLREAIALTNADITLEMLSDVERSQVAILPDVSGSSITFAMPLGNTIRLKSLLPPLRQAGLRLDGTNSASEDSTAITLMPDDSVSIPMGFLAMADNLSIQGFNFHGFHSDINNFYADYPFVGSVVVSTGQMLYDLGRLVDIVQLEAPRNVLIEANQFGDETSAEDASAFGVVLFEADQATIQQNQFFNQSSSAILTGKIAHNFTVSDNLFIGNGREGLGNAIHLGGNIDQGMVRGNQFCRNYGSGVFMFKPQGAIAIENNQFYDNGLPAVPLGIDDTATQTKTAAVYLMGVKHRVINNQFLKQNGAGVVVAAYPRTEGIMILDNTFAELQGLSIDLVTRESTGIYDYLSGDGANPLRNFRHRRTETGNSAVDAPQFAGSEFFPFGDRVLVSGTADPGVTIDLYRVLEGGSYFGPLNELVLQTVADAEGKFEVYLTDWELGETLSAIATDSYYGTSEAAENAIIRSYNDSMTAVEWDEALNIVIPEECKPPSQ